MLRYKVPLLLIIGVMCFGNQTVTAQTEDQVIKFVAKYLKQGYHLRLKGDQLTLTVNEGGRLVRKDEVFLDDLDPDRVAFSTEENALIVKCYSEEPKCIDRELPLQKTRRGYSRMTMSVTSAANGEQLALAFRHLLLLWQDPDYEGSVSLGQ